MSYYSRTALRELKKRYLNILKKCFLLNMMAFSFVLPVQAETTEPTLTPSEELETVIQTTRRTISSDTTIDLAGKNLTYSGITSSSKGGVFYVNNSRKLEFKNSKDTTTDPLLLFENNKASQGGVIYNYGNPVIFVTDVSFMGNSASYGGAIYNDYGSIAFNGDATFTDNTASSYGGAIYNYSNLTFNGETVFTGNTASSYGGAIYNYWTLTFDENSATKFENNTASNGGAIYNYSNLTFNGEATFTDNSASSSGGAIYNNKTTTFGEKSKTKFENNTASKGGAIYNYSNLTFNGEAAFTGNSASSYGGAIYNYSNLTFDENSATKFENNTASNGGAIYNNSSLTFNGDATFTDNSASSSGGAIYINKTTTFGEKSKIKFENNTASKGGAIYNNSSLTFNGDATFTDNSASSSGGAIYNNSTITFDENSVLSFSNNKANDKLNDIYNSGTLNILGTVESDIHLISAGGTIGLKAKDVDSDGKVTYGGSYDLKNTTLDLSGDGIKEVTIDNLTLNNTALKWDVMIDSLTGAITQDIINASGTGVFSSLIMDFSNAETNKWYTVSLTNKNGSALFDESTNIMILSEDFYKTKNIYNADKTQLTDVSIHIMDATLPTTLGEVLRSSTASTFDLSQYDIPLNEGETLNYVITEKDLVNGAIGNVGSGKKTIIGATDKAEDTVINANGTSKLFNLSDGDELILSNLTIMNANQALYNYNNTSGSVILNNVDFKNNIARAIYNYGSNATITFGGDATFTGNSATGTSVYGGVIYNDGSNATITFNDVATFTDNSATATGSYSQGGAIYNDYGSIAFNGDATFTDNTATGSSASGGAIYNNSSLTFNGDATFTGNSVTATGSSGNAYGGAIYNYSNLTFSGEASFTDNSASSSGGAIYNYRNLTFDENSTLSFSNNKANDKLNDIYNSGTLNILGTVESDIHLISAGGTIGLKAKDVDNDGKVTYGGSYDLKNTTLDLSGDGVKEVTIDKLMIDNVSLKWDAEIKDEGDSYSITQDISNLNFSEKFSSGLVNIIGANKNNWYDISLANNNGTLLFDDVNAVDILTEDCYKIKYIYNDNKTEKTGISINFIDIELPKTLGDILRPITNESLDFSQYVSVADGEVFNYKITDKDLVNGAIGTVGAGEKKIIGVSDNANNTVINGSGLSLFSLDSEASLHLENLTISNSKEVFSGINYSLGKVTLNNVVFAGNENVIYNSYGANLTADGDVTFINNSKTKTTSYYTQAGAIYTNTYNATINTNITFNGKTHFLNNIVKNENDSVLGGAIYNYVNGTRGKESAILFTNDVEFVGNIATGVSASGGAIYNSSDQKIASITFDGKTNFSDNASIGASSAFGGAIYNHAQNTNANATITFGENSILSFSNNTANGELNDIYNRNGSIYILGTVESDIHLISKGGTIALKAKDTDGDGKVIYGGSYDLTDTLLDLSGDGGKELTIEDLTLNNTALKWDAEIKENGDGYNVVNDISNLTVTGEFTGGEVSILSQTKNKWFDVLFAEIYDSSLFASDANINIVIDGFYRTKDIYNEDKTTKIGFAVNFVDAELTQSLGDFLRSTTALSIDLAKYNLVVEADAPIIYLLNKKDLLNGEIGELGEGKKTIVGATDKSSDTIINANGVSNLFDLGEGDELSLSNLTIMNAKQALYNDNNTTGSVTLNNVDFINNTASSTGGAIYNYGPNATIAFNGDASFSGNSAIGSYYTYGGAIYNSGPNATIIFNGDATFSGNSVTGSSSSSSYGGAIYNYAYNSNANITFGGDASFSGNSSTGSYFSSYGGAIYNYARYSGSNATITFNEGSTVTFSGNTASYDGGAIYNYADEADATITFNEGSTVTFSGNTASRGGAIYNYARYSGSNATITFNGDATFTDNSVAATGSNVSGGAISNYGGDANATITFNGDATFTDNSATGPSSSGGSIDNSGNITFDGKTTFSNNLLESSKYSGKSNGGAISNSGIITFNEETMFKFNSVTASGSSGRANGGAIYNYDGSITFNNETLFESNSSTGTNSSASSYGGVIYNYDGDITFEEEASFSNNKAIGLRYSYGGAIYNGGTITFNNQVSFTDNTSLSSGGAIYNYDTITFGENSVLSFENNIANDKLNDIYNSGTLNILGTVESDIHLISEYGTIGLKAKDTDSDGKVNYGGSYDLIDTMLDLSGDGVKEVTIDNLTIENSAVSWDAEIKDSGESYTVAQDISALNPTGKFVFGEITVVGNNTNQNEWYDVFIPNKDTLFDENADFSVVVGGWYKKKDIYNEDNTKLLGVSVNFANSSQQTLGDFLRSTTASTIDLSQYNLTVNEGEPITYMVAAKDMINYEMGELGSGEKTIIGATNRAEDTVINANGLSGLFNLGEGDELSLSNLSVSNASQAINNYKGNVTLNNVVFNDNYYDTLIYNEAGTVKFEGDVSFKNNSSYELIYNDQGTIILGENASIFVENESSNNYIYNNEGMIQILGKIKSDIYLTSYYGTIGLKAKDIDGDGKVSYIGTYDLRDSTLDLSGDGVKDVTIDNLYLDNVAVIWDAEIKDIDGEYSIHHDTLNISQSQGFASGAMLLMSQNKDKWYDISLSELNNNQMQSLIQGYDPVSLMIDGWHKVKEIYDEENGEKIGLSINFVDVPLTQTLGDFLRSTTASTIDLSQYNLTVNEGEPITYMIAEKDFLKGVMGELGSGEKTIIGATNRAEDTVINANGFGQVFNLGANDKLNLSYLTITNAMLDSDGGIIYNSSGDVALSHVKFKNNAVSGVGGAIYNDLGTITFEGETIFSDNTASSDGGAIYNYADDANATITFNGDATFSGNSVTGSSSSSFSYGGAICNYDGDANATITFNGDVTFIGNSSVSSYGYGGAIYNGGTITFGREAIFENNVATATKEKASGGAIDNYGTITFMDNVRFSNNTALGADLAGGAAISNERSGQIYFNGDETIFENNNASGRRGELGVIENYGNIEFNNKVTFVGNKTASGGGAVIGNDSGSVTFTKDSFVTIVNNTGAIDVSDNGIVKFEGDFIFSGNHIKGLEPYYGKDIYNLRAKIDFAQGEGKVGSLDGAIFNSQSSEINKTGEGVLILGDNMENGWNVYDRYWENVVLTPSFTQTAGLIIAKTDVVNLAETHEILGGELKTHGAEINHDAVVGKALDAEGNIVSVGSAVHYTNLEEMNINNDTVTQIIKEDGSIVGIQFAEEGIGQPLVLDLIQKLKKKLKLL